LAATMDDGQLPVFQPLGEEGYVVLVEKPGAHHLTLDLALGVQTRLTKGADRGFDLDLPRAAITLLESFDLPAGVAEVRVGSRTIPAKRQESSPGNRLESVPLGLVDHLEMSWKGSAAAAPKGRPILASRARLLVRVEEAHVFTEAELTLQVLSGETAQWRIQVPPPFILERPQSQDERIQSIELPNKDYPVLTIRFKEPSAEPLKLVLQGRQ